MIKSIYDIFWKTSLSVRIQSYVKMELSSNLVSYGVCILTLLLSVYTSHLPSDIPSRDYNEQTHTWRLAEGTENSVFRYYCISLCIPQEIYPSIHHNISYPWMCIVIEYLHISCHQPRLSRNLSFLKKVEINALIKRPPRISVHPSILWNGQKCEFLSLGLILT